MQTPTTELSVHKEVDPPLRERIVKSGSFTHSFASPQERPKSYKRWTEEPLESACKCIEQGELSLRCVAEAYDIPKSTLYDRVTGRVKPGSMSGPPRYLTDFEEGELVNFLVGCSKIGYSRSRKQVLAIEP